MSLQPSDHTVVGNLTVAGNITSFTNTIGTGPYGNLLTGSRHPLINELNNFGISTSRDKITTSGNGTVTKTFGNIEYELSVSDGGDLSSLLTRTRGHYLPGLGGDASVTVRLRETTYGSGQEALWGYADNNDGFLFLYDDTGFNVVVLKAGTRTTTVNQSNFNVDKLDGNGPSGHTLDLTRGYTWNITFSGTYGAVNFRIVINDDGGSQIVQTIHRHIPTTSPVVENFDLPLRTTLTQSSASDKKMYVTERQYSLIGNAMSVVKRTTSPYVEAKTILRSDGFVPLISVKRKSNWCGKMIRLSSVEFSCNTEIVFQIRVAANLTGTSFQDIPYTVNTETALQQDTSATSLSGGIVKYLGIIPYNINAATAGTIRSNQELDDSIDEDDVLTVCAYTNLADVTRISCAVRIIECW
jgi:hypothetical protein